MRMFAAFMSRCRICDYKFVSTRAIHSVKLEVTYIMKISQSFQELLHVALDLRLAEANVRVRQHSAQIMLGVWRNHVQDCALLALCALLVR
jgi:hypothetical protein